MRVLHTYSGNLFGGLESFLTNLARRDDLHRRDGVTHEFALCFEGQLMAQLRAAGATVTNLGAVRISRPWTMWRARRGLRKLLSRREFGAVVCHLSWSHALFAKVAEKRGIPVVFYQHGAMARPSWLDHWAGQTTPRLLIAVSAHTASTAANVFANVPIRVIHSPLAQCVPHDDNSNRVTVRRMLNIASNQVVIFQASRMEPIKGHHYLIAALARLTDVPNWCCLIAGGAQRPEERAYEQSVLALVAKLKLSERVRFLGERRDVPALLAAADVYCQANIGPEGFSLAFMEAFCAGIPVVTTRLGGAPELIDDASGILTPLNDIDALADALRRLIVDEAFRRQLGANAFRRVQAVADPERQFAKLNRALLEVSGSAVSHSAEVLA